MTLENITIEDLHHQISICERCKLCKERTKAVPGSGRLDADIMFVGEGPGKNEDLQGLPFVGAAGRVLGEMMESIGLTRDDAFITNVVKCRPPGNRDPEPEEVAACSSYLHKQVQLIDPLLIVTLGRHSMNRFVPGKRISDDHGKAFRRTIDGLGTRVFFPIYHPAACLYRPQLKEDIIKDFAKVPLLLEKLKNEQKQ